LGKEMMKNMKISVLIISLVFALQNIYSQNQVFNKDSIVNVLESVFKTDTELRYQLDTLLTKVDYNSPEVFKMYTLISKNDSVNVEIVRKIIDKYGWLSVDETSKNANDALFLVIQHADLKTQLQYLPVLTKAVQNKKALPQKLALLVDRTNMHQGKFQIYGSQLKGINTQDLVFFPIYDEPNVNKRRKEIGLEPLEKYAKRFKLKYTLPTKDKYLNKFVFEGNIQEMSGDAIENASIYFGNNEFIAKTDINGRFSIIVDKKYRGWAFIFRKKGYESFALCLDRKDIDVFTGSYRLNILTTKN
jgi:hypothetical protein